MTNSLPWWALSPSPFSILFYLVLAFLGYRKLKKSYANPPRDLMLFVDSLLVLAFVVFLGDVVWCLCSGFRWAYLHPLDLPQIHLSIMRNLAGLGFVFVFIFDLFRKGVISIKRRVVIAFAANCVFMIVWFLLATSPAFTDWTYAIRHGYSSETVLFSFLISHVVGKTFSAALFFSLFESFN